MCNQVAPLSESGPLHGQSVVQCPLQEGLRGGGPSRAGFDRLSCRSSEYKIRVLCEMQEVG